MKPRHKTDKVIRFEGQDYHCVSIDSEPWCRPELALRMPHLQHQLSSFNFTPCRWRFICKEGVIAAVPLGYRSVCNPDAIPVEFRKKTKWDKTKRPLTEKERASVIEWCKTHKWLESHPLSKEEQTMLRMVRPLKPEETIPPEGIYESIHSEYFAVFEYLAAAYPNIPGDCFHEIMDVIKYECIYDNGNRDYFVRVQLCEATIAETALLNQAERAGLKPEEPTMTKAPAPAEHYIFRRKGEAWEIRYDAEDSVFLPHRKGFDYIRLLLANPGKEFNLSEIKDKIDPPLPSEHNAKNLEDTENRDDEQDPVIGIRKNLHLEDQKVTPKTIKQCHSLIKDMEEERKHPHISRNRRDDLEEEIKALRYFISQNTDKAGRPRKFSNADENYRSAVTANINNAIKSLRPKLKDLAQHLSCIRKGYNLKYSPESTINWLTDDM